MNAFEREGPGWTVRVAGRGDNADLCALFKSVHVKGSLDLTQERDPDFFKLLDLHLGEHETLLVRTSEGDAVACGSVVVRDGWLDGGRARTGYLCDLRITPAFRGGTLMKIYGEYFETVRERYGVEVLTTVIFDSNKAARAALTQRSEKRASQPIYREMTPFQMTSVQFSTRKPRPSRAVRRADDRDLTQLSEFLARRGRERVLGEVFDDGLLDRRLAAWPGLRVEDFLLALDASGRIAGCVAPWDTSAFKRTRVLGYHGAMLLARVAINAAARVLGATPLPSPGDCFRFKFLTHLEVEGDDPAVLRDLLLAAYDHHRPGHWNFLSAMVPRGSPLERAFDGFQVQRTPMTLYSVTTPTSRLAGRDFRTARPGFEMALS
jgi:hypothetical protein